MYKNEFTVKDRLEDILDCIKLIGEWSEGMDMHEDFHTSPGSIMAFNACIMRLQVIGEHVGKLFKEIPDSLDKHPDIPWHAIYGLRNIISHEYANIDEVIIDSVIKDDLPKLKDVTEELLQAYS